MSLLQKGLIHHGGTEEGTENTEERRRKMIFICVYLCPSVSPLQKAFFATDSHR